jgi:hypothetical protein
MVPPRPGLAQNSRALEQLPVRDLALDLLKDLVK